MHCNWYAKQVFIAFNYISSKENCQGKLKTIYVNN